MRENELESIDDTVERILLLCEDVIGGVLLYWRCAKCFVRKKLKER